MDLAPSDYVILALAAGGALTGLFIGFSGALAFLAGAVGAEHGLDHGLQGRVIGAVHRRLGDDLLARGPRGRVLDGEDAHPGLGGAADGVGGVLEDHGVRWRCFPPPGSGSWTRCCPP